MITIYRTPKAKFHFDNIYDNSPVKYGPIMLSQIGDLICDTGYIGGMHRQNVFEVSYIMEGKGETVINGVHYKLSKGMIVIDKIGDMHEMFSSIDEPMRFFYLGFLFDNYDNKDDTIIQLKSFFENTTGNIAEDFFNIGKCFLNLFYEIVKEDLFTNELIENYIMQILIMTYRAFNHNMHTRIYDDMIKCDVPPFIYDVINYLDIKGYKVGYLNDLTKEINYSYQYVSKVFSKTMGIQIKEYAEKKRFERAIEMVREDVRICDIAEELGYNTVQSFSKAFKKYVGISPINYLHNVKIQD